jgi:hypothetical protein
VPNGTGGPVIFRCNCRGRQPGRFFTTGGSGWNDLLAPVGLPVQPGRAKADPPERAQPLLAIDITETPSARFRAMIPAPPIPPS